MKKSLFFFAAALFAISFQSCKDKNIEKRIYKEGEWNIKELHWTIVYQTNSGQQVKSGTSYDAGTFTFDKTTGKYSYTVDTFQRSGTFNWDVDNKEITVSGVKQTFNMFTGYFSQTAIALSGKETEKGAKLQLEGSDVDQEGGSGGNIEQFALTGTFILGK